MQVSLVSWGMKDRKCKVKIGDKGLSENSGLLILFPQSVKRQQGENKHSDVKRAVALRLLGSSPDGKLVLPSALGLFPRLC